ncbi:uncharacterized protein L201_005137 [Kwoniella dendrophila CBS 6074]|uniref:Myb-like domain-containing protein n=1 Tax=Kwoniella dendrophila CBS 6074 TaxID=1295534 RepID=A0AAX4JZD8_9TREE
MSPRSKKTDKPAVDDTSSEGEDTKLPVSTNNDSSETPSNKQTTPKKRTNNKKTSESPTVVSTVEIKWDEVAAKMGPNYTGKQCREQWQRATGKRIRKALEEE